MNARSNQRDDRVFNSRQIMRQRTIRSCDIGGSFPSLQIGLADMYESLTHGRPRTRRRGLPSTPSGRS